VAPRLGIVCGLALERDLLRRAGVVDDGTVACRVANGGAAATVAPQLLDEGCAGLISFGLSGGLHPRLPPGCLLLAEGVHLPDGRILATDPRWRSRLQARLLPQLDCASGLLAGSADALTTPAAKADCHRRTSALALDMESAGVALAAAARQRPFLVVRAIADPAGRDLPAWLTATVRADGTTPIAAVLAGLLRRPLDLPALVALARDSRAASRSLSRVALLAGPLFQFDG
jgi:hopanoid-associated phosphorylase